LLSFGFFQSTCTGPRFGLETAAQAFCGPADLRVAPRPAERTGGYGWGAALDWEPRPGDVLSGGAEMPKLNDESKIAIGLLAVLAIWTLVAQGPDNSLLVFGQWITKDAITVFNGLLALVTGGLVLVGWRQVRVTKDIADRQVRDTEILQRAYVSVEPGGLNQLVGLEREDKVVVGHVALQNVGHLPARNVSWSIDIKQAAAGNLNDFPIDENRFCGNNVIPPGTKAIQGSDKVTLNPGGLPPRREPTGAGRVGDTAGRPPPPPVLGRLPRA
jgi:hypothetical protein